MAQRRITGARLQKMNRDTIVAGAGICAICSNLFTGAPHAGATTADHVVPLARGGDEFGPKKPAHGTGNPCPICSVYCGTSVHCNQIRGRGTIEQARARIQKKHDEHAKWCQHAPAAVTEQTATSPGRDFMSIPVNDGDWS